MKQFASLVFVSLLAFSCLGPDDPKSILISQDLSLPLHPSEYKLPKDQEQVNHYFALLGKTHLQIPLLQPVKGEAYTLFVGLPIGSSMRDMERSWSMQGAAMEESREGSWEFIWKERDTLGYALQDLVAARGDNLLYLMLAIRSEDAQSIDYSVDSLINRLAKLDTEPSAP